MFNPLDPVTSNILIDTVYRLGGGKGIFSAILKNDVANTASLATEVNVPKGPNVGSIVNKLTTRLHRKEWINILFSTPLIEKYISGVIIDEETLSSQTFNLFLKKDISLTELLNDKNILIGLKMCKGVVELKSHEKITIGIDTLIERLNKISVDIKFVNVRFMTWRSVYTPLSSTQLNAHSLALFAKIVQSYGIVPNIEIIFDDMDQSLSLEYVTNVYLSIYRELFGVLIAYNVWLPGIIISMNFVMPSLKYLKSKLTHSKKEFTDFSGYDKESYDICNATLDVISNCIPQAVPSIYILGSNLTDNASTVLFKKILQLKEERTISKKNQLLQYISFNFNHQLQQRAYDNWQHKIENISTSQKIFLNSCETLCND